MDDISAAIIAVVVGACFSAVVVAADKRGLRQPPGPPMTFPARAFEDALRTPGTGWFRKKLRCDRKSFLRIYELVCAAWGHGPGPNCKLKPIKRVALTMMYLAQGGTKDQAASALGISRSRGVVYINETLAVLSDMARKFVTMPLADEAAVIEEGFFATAGFPETVGAIDGTIVRIARPHDFEGWYCRKNFPAAECVCRSTELVVQNKLLLGRASAHSSLREWMAAGPSASYPTHHMFALSGTRSARPHCSPLAASEYFTVLRCSHLNISPEMH